MAKGERGRRPETIECLSMGELPPLPTCTALHSSDRLRHACPVMEIEAAGNMSQQGEARVPARTLAAWWLLGLLNNACACMPSLS